MKSLEQRASFAYVLGDYYLLTKPGIIFGNLVTTASGFFFASSGTADLLLAAMTFLGLSLVIGSACGFNNYIDKAADAKMERTQNRPLPSGRLNSLSVLIFSSSLLLLGGGILAFFTTALATLLSIIGFLFYVIVYSFSKYRSKHATLVGSLAGALPPVIGYTAVTGALDSASLTFFALMVFWQMPHFFAIALRRIEDYRKAGIPVLPVSQGVKATQFQSSVYIILFTAASLLLPFTQPMRLWFAPLVSLLGLFWLFRSMRGDPHSKEWARSMFILSLVVIMILSIAIPFSVYKK